MEFSRRGSRNRREHAAHKNRALLAELTKRGHFEPAKKTVDTARSGMVEWGDGRDTDERTTKIIMPKKKGDVVNMSYMINLANGGLITSDIDADHLENALVADDAMFWIDSNGKLSSPAEGHPSIHYLKEHITCYHKNGALHRTDGPAIESPDRTEFWIHGLRLTESEFDNYIPEENRIQFFNDDGWTDREDGPAIIKFLENGTVVQKWFKDGICNSIRETNKDRLNADERWEQHVAQRKITPKQIVLPKATPKKKEATPIMESSKFPKLTEQDVEFFREKFSQPENLQLLRSMREDILSARNAIMRHRLGDEEFERTYGENKEVVLTDSKPKIKEYEVDQGKIIRSKANTSGTRIEQYAEGVKFGFKKGLVNNGSQLLAQKMVSFSPQAGNEWAERLVQFITLVGVAEMIKRMPEGVREKMHITEEAQSNAVSMLRYIGGENIGGDIVDIAANVLPVLFDLIKDLSTEELNQMAEELENSSVQVEELELS